MAHLKRYSQMVVRICGKVLCINISRKLKHCIKAQALTTHEQSARWRVLLVQYSEKCCSIDYGISTLSDRKGFTVTCEISTMKPREVIIPVSGSFKYQSRLRVCVETSRRRISVVLI